MRATIIIASVVATVTLGLEDAEAICRRVVEIGSAPPIIDPEQSVIVIKRSDYPIGQDCTAPASPDAGVPPDASVFGGADAGTATVDAGIGDAGGADAGSGCVVRYGDAITMIVRPQFTIGPDGSSFALLMVTPAPPVVEVQDQGLFRELAEVTATRVSYDDVYVEDSSLGYQCNDPKWNSGNDFGGGCGGGGNGGWTPPGPQDPVYPADAGTPGNVDIQTIGAYDVAVLAIEDVAELGEWLDANAFAHTPTDLAAIEPYVVDGWTVIVARINAEQELDDGGLEPLSFTYEGSEIRLPLGVSYQPAGGESFLSVYVVAEGRYDFPGATVPYARLNPMGGMGSATFLTRNDMFADLSNTAADDPIAERVDGDPQFHESVTLAREIHIPVAECPPPPPGSSDDSGGGDAEISLCGCGSTQHPPSPRRARGMIILVMLCVAVLGRRRWGRGLSFLFRRA